MEFKFKKGDIVKTIKEKYLELENKYLVVDESFSLGHTPTYKIHVENEEWKRYICYEDKLKKVRR